ncbi:hypothetical protein ACRJ4W_10890 [Streptomyces sp. GLT-R25]
MADIDARGTFRRLGAVLRGSAGAYWTLTGLWVLLRAGTLAVGLLFQRLFDEIGAGGGVWLLIAWVAAIEGARLCLQFGRDDQPAGAAGPVRNDDADAAGTAEFRPARPGSRGPDHPRGGAAGGG